MDVAVPVRAGVYSPAERGQAMADTQTVVGSVFGSGAVVAVVTYGLSRIGAKKREDEAAYTARMAEAIALRDSDRDRLKALEDWRTDAMKWQENAVAKMEDMRTDKIRLEGVIDSLRHQIATDQVQIEAFKQDGIMYNMQIAELNNKIAVQTAELAIAYQRLEAIKNADPEEMKRSLLYQLEHPDDAKP